MSNSEELEARREANIKAKEEERKVSSIHRQRCKWHCLVAAFCLQLGSFDRRRLLYVPVLAEMPELFSAEALVCFLLPLELRMRTSR